MGEALLAGLLADGMATPAGLWATDVDSERLSALQTRYAIQTGHDNREAASWADVLVLAVKPQMMSRVLDDFKDHLPEKTLVISVATGISLARIAAALGGNRKLVRVMTNTPVLVRAGASALAILSGEPTVVITVAPTALASWIAAVPTPLPPAWMRIVWPAAWMGITQVLQTQQRPAGVHADVEARGEFGESAVQLRGEAEQLVAMVVEEGAERGKPALAV